MNVKEIVKKTYKENWRLVIFILFLVITLISVRLVSPLFLRELISNIEVNNTELLIIWSISFAMAIIFTFILSSIYTSKLSKLGNIINQRLGLASYNAYLRSELLEANKIPNEDIVKRIVHHSEKIGNKFYADNIIATFYQVSLFIGLNIVFLVINPWLALLTIVTFPLYYFIMKQINKLSNKRLRKVKDNNRVLIDNVKEASVRLKSIKLQNGVNEEEDIYRNIVSDYSKSLKKYEYIKQFEERKTASLFTSIIMLAIIAVGGFLITQGNLNLGIMLASILIVSEVYPVFVNLITRFSSKLIEKNLIEELNEILSLKQENRADTVQQLDEIYNLKYKEVSYDYGPNTSFNLDDISFELKKGEKLGILGLTSSGKTTLNDLLMKIIRPKQGSILINNCDINKVNSYYLRDLIASVPQKHPLIKGTFAQNITYPLEFDEYKYNDALNRCRLKPLLNRLENRDQTIIDDNSPFLSPSDKQQIAIANALYKDAKIYIFDDATTQMSQETEKEIIDEIYKLKNKITILISNRIYNLIKCDKIIILNNGRIVESGKTSELLDNDKSTFARLVGEQNLIRASLKG